MKKVFLFVLCLGLIGFMMAKSAMAATEDQKQTAINNGLSYLAANIETNGYVNAGDYYYDVAGTGSALLAFLEEGYSAGTNVVIGGYDYGDVVGAGLNWLFTNAAYKYALPGTAEPNGTTASGWGVKFNQSTGSWNGDNNYNNIRDTYLTGIVLPAIAATGTPGAVVGAGPLAGMTYAQVVQDTVDYFAYGQSDSGWAQGGWRYYADYNQSDNSTSQWPTVSIMYASGMGISAPAGVETELDVWIKYIQNSGDGGSYYSSSTDGMNSNVSRTGTLLLQMAYSDWDGSEAGIVNPKFGTRGGAVNAALNYIDSQWLTSANNTWNGNFDHPYAMWAAYKGLETTVGLSDTTAITNLRSYNPLTMDLDVGDTWNWHEDYCEWLVDEFAADGGHWNGDPTNTWNSWLATAWGVNILNATEIPDDPIPEPSTMILLAFGLLGMGMISRRKKVK